MFYPTFPEIERNFERISIGSFFFLTQLQSESELEVLGSIISCSQFSSLLYFDLSISTSSVYRWDLNFYITLMNWNIPCFISPSGSFLFSTEHILLFSLSSHSLFNSPQFGFALIQVELLSARSTITSVLLKPMVNLPFSSYSTSQRHLTRCQFPCLQT